MDRTHLLASSAQLPSRTNSIPMRVLSSSRGAQRGGAKAITSLGMLIKPHRSSASWCLAAAAPVLLFILLAGPIRLHAITNAALQALNRNLHLPGLSAPVLVRRDGHGVPHIEAANENDLFLAQGYVTAQDRLWQMDSYRRFAFGELAEVYGPSQLEHDRAQRVLQIRVTARRIFANLSSSDRTRVDLFARGVNEYIEQNRETLPPEFKLLSYSPRTWTGEDSIGIGLMMVQGLDTHFDAKIGRERISAKLRNAELEADLYPVGSSRDRPPGDDSEPRETRAERASARVFSSEAETSPSLSAEISDARSEDLLALRRSLGMPNCSGCNSGSNNWVIAGRFTQSGKPLLSNDMHLTLLVPDIWYMIDLKAPGYHVAGVTMAGVPGIIAGHNEHVAWGITALYGDVQDLYVETLDGRGDYLAADGSWRPLSVDHQHIAVRGGAGEELDVQSTAHGPLLNPILKNEKRPVALKWTIFDPTLNVMPTYELGKAANWTEFSKVLSSWCWPAENVAYGDDHGVIAYQAAGKIPQRPAGLVGVPIQDNAHEWNGYIPFNKMPSAINPPSGILATANSRVTQDGTAYPLSLNWGDPYRTERIYKSLQGRAHLTRQDMLAVQTDIYSEVNQKFGRRFAEAIDRTAGVDDRLRTAAALMRTWDGRMSADSAAASLVAKTRNALWNMILEPKLGNEATEYIWSERGVAQEQIVMRECPDWLPAGYASWDALLTNAVRTAIADKSVPADLTEWSYGSWHRIDLEHPLAMLFSLTKQVAGTGSHPLGGDGTTVNQEAGTLGPSQRFTMDWGDPDGSTENLVMGESGNPQSPYFRDQWQHWYQGTTFSVPFTRKAIAAQTQHALQLLP